MDGKSRGDTVSDDRIPDSMAIAAVCLVAFLVLLLGIILWHAVNG